MIPTVSKCRLTLFRAARSPAAPFPAALFLAALCLAALPIVAAAQTAADRTAAPQCLDERLRIELFAEHPQIVTPTGLAVLPDGDVLVVESHTHFPPEGYQGPRTDRILRLSDRDGDGRAERVETFFEGTVATMSLALSPDGEWVYVATRNELFRLPGERPAGVAPQDFKRQRLVQLETKGNYPHNGLSGFAFDAAGDVWFGLGENLGEPYKLHGAGPTTLAGGGEGGGVFRCDAEGRSLRRVATGFWNPFHLARDAFGRVFAVDNDPDWRPPCRLLQVVAGGDYGYRFRNGRRGLHPFTAWFGELPGTLGVVAGTGEAPSGVLAYDSDLLPADYRGDLLVTSWGYHSLERYRLAEHGATVVSSAETIIKGGGEFRPVAIAVAPDGALFLSDWVSRSYQLHGQGRVWRISRAAAAPPTRAKPRRAPSFESLHGPARLQAAAESLSRGAADAATLRTALRSELPEARALAAECLGRLGLLGWEDVQGEADSRVRAAAARQLTPWPGPLPQEHPAVRLEAALRLDAAQPAPWRRLAELLEDEDAWVRGAARHSLLQNPAALDEAALRGFPPLEAALLRQTLDTPEARQAIPAMLRSADASLRGVAIRWVGESQLQSHADELRRALEDGRAGEGLLTTCLAALSMLRGVPPAEFEKTMQEEVAALLEREQLAPAALSLALRNAPPDHPRLTIERLRGWIELERLPVDVRQEAVLTLAASARPERAEALLRAARSDTIPLAVRLTAIASLAPQDPESRSQLLLWAADGARPEAQREALRALADAKLNEAESRQLSELPESLAPLRERARDPDWRRSSPPPLDRPDLWIRDLGRGDPVAGKRVFHSRAALCSKCHRVAGRGGDVGPDLSSAGRLSATRLVESIVQPSREIAPQFTAWAIQRHDGSAFQGVFLTERGEEEQYATATGEVVTVQHDDIARRRALDQSIMPDGIPQRLAADELNDLIAYLTTLGAGSESKRRDSKTDQ